MLSKKRFAGTPISGSGFTNVGKNFILTFTPSIKPAENAGESKKSQYRIQPARQHFMLDIL